MNSVEGIAVVKAMTAEIYIRKRRAAVALCLYYAGLVLQSFRQRQANNRFWTNRTRTAVNTVFSEAIDEKGVIGFFLAHAVEYGVYLELANDRKHEAIRPVVMSFYARFMRDLGEIYVD